LEIKLYGSLALTGVGHATDTAILAGLSGCLPDRSTPEELAATVRLLRADKRMRVLGRKAIDFDEVRDLHWLRNELLPPHPNGMEFSAMDAAGNVLKCNRYFSVGGGFVASESEMESQGAGQKERTTAPTLQIPYPFTTAHELLEMARVQGSRIDEIVHANERVRWSEAEIEERLSQLWSVMSQCIDRGCLTSGLLPGALRIVRRAPQIYQRLSRGAVLPPSHWLTDHAQRLHGDPLEQLDWISLFAMAVNEENAAGGRVVTAPTNGAAGIIPAVLFYYWYFIPGAHRSGIHRFLKTAGAIGLLYKRNASLSAAEMGCQGEVGVACSMAAAGLAACMNGSIEQIENAAEIGMEHNLGLTCDPIAGLVQVPCIERNTMGATKAVNAARLAVLYGDGKHFVSLDRVIETMRQTGVDMQAKYKETSLGGLAVNVVDC
jgi:L-serine dehydratase